MINLDEIEPIALKEKDPDRFRENASQIIKALNDAGFEIVKKDLIAGVIESADKVINYIENDAEIAMPLEELMPDGKHLTKREYGRVLLKYLVKELREHFL